MKDNYIQLKFPFINNEREELVCLFIVICSTVLVEDIFNVVIFGSKFLIVDIFLDFPCFIELDAGVNLLSKGVHFVRIPLLSSLVDRGLVVIRNVIVPELKVCNFKPTLLKFFDLHQ